MLKNLVKNLKPSSTLAINEASRKLEEQRVHREPRPHPGLAKEKPRKTKENAGQNLENHY